MRKSNYIISLYFLMFLFVSCGKKEQPKFYHFDKNRKIIEEKFISVIKSSDSICDVSAQYHYFEDNKKYPVYFYIKSNPTEIYVVTFVHYSDEWDNKTSSCILVLLDVFDTEAWALDGFQIIQGKKSVMNQQVVECFEKVVISPILE